MPHVSVHTENNGTAPKISAEAGNTLGAPLTINVEGECKFCIFTNDQKLTYELADAINAVIYRHERDKASTERTRTNVHTIGVHQTALRLLATMLKAVFDHLEENDECGAAIAEIESLTFKWTEVVKRLRAMHGK